MKKKKKARQNYQPLLIQGMQDFNDFPLANISLSFPRSHPGAHVPPAADDEIGQEPLRHHLRHRSGAAGGGALRGRRRGARVGPQNWHLLPQTPRLRLLRSLLRLLGTQLPG